MPSLVNILCYNVEICETDRSLVQRSHDVYVCVCVSISVIRCNNASLQTQWVGRKVRLRKKERKLFMKVVPKGNNLVVRTAMYVVSLNVHKKTRLIIMSLVSHKLSSARDRHI